MKTETVLYLENGETLHLLIHDNRDMVEPGETCIESHLHYPIIGRYQIFYVPESWDKNELYTRASSGCHVRKVVYHMPAEWSISDLAQYDPTAEQLKAYGEKLADADNGVDAQLYYINGDRWVILPDQTVINYDLIGEADYSQPISFNI